MTFRNGYPCTVLARYCPTPYSPMVLVGLCVYLISFQSGLGPVPWIMNAEVVQRLEKKTFL